MREVIESDIGTTRVIQLNHDNPLNPFNAALESATIKAFGKADQDDAVRAIILTGGADRSFSAGGDFNEVQNMAGGVEVEQWIDRLIKLYLAVLHVNKPTVAAIDGHAIGIGFQLAMMFDWRVIADTGEFCMPELQHGIACTIGSAIMKHFVSFSVMQEIILGCEPVSADQARAYGLVNQIVPRKELMQAALAAADKLARYPELAFVDTKRAMIEDMSTILVNVAEVSKQAHKAAFSARSAQEHFKNILREKYKADQSS